MALDSLRDDELGEWGEVHFDDSILHSALWTGAEKQDTRPEHEKLITEYSLPDGKLDWDRVVWDDVSTQVVWALATRAMKVWEDAESLRSGLSGLWTWDTPNQYRIPNR